MRLFKRFHVSWWIVGVMVAAIIVCLPLTKKGFFISDDGEWMVIRLSAFFQSFREGQFPVRFLGRLNNSYGYPVANFLYPGFLYIGSFIHILGFSFVNSIKIILFSSVLGGGIFIFYWLRNFFSEKASMLGALGFIFSPYLLFDIYKRGSVGEVLAIFAVTALLYAVEVNAAWLVSIFSAAVILSHNSLAALFIPLIVLYLLIRKRAGLLVPVILGIGMTTFFWFPAIYEQRYVLFPMIVVSHPEQYFIDISKIFLFGLVNILAFFITLRNGKRNVVHTFFLWVFGISIIMATAASSPIWTIPVIGKLFQFPYRFISLILVAGPWLIAWSETIITKENKRGLITALFLLWFFPAYFILSHIDFTDRTEGYYTTNEGTTTVANEYMPRWIKEFSGSRAHQRLVFYQGQGKIEAKTLSTQKIAATIYADEPSTIQINSIYYPGWGITVDDQYISPDYQNVYGLMRVPVPSGKHTFVAEFRETIPRFIADGISVATVIAYFIYLFWRRQRTARKKRI